MSLEKQINEPLSMPNYEIRWRDLIPRRGLKEYRDRNFGDFMMGGNKSVLSTFTLIAYNSLYTSVPMMLIASYYIR